MMRTLEKIFALLSVAGVMTLTFAMYAHAEGSGSNHLDEARTTIERSSLAKEAQVALLAKADRAVTAGIPAEDVAIIITRGLKQGVSGPTLEGFLETATVVKEQHLPSRLVLDRIEQGLAKGVPGERISGVTQNLSRHLATAKPMVEKIESSGVKPAPSGRPIAPIETVARALERSIPPDAILRMGEKVQARKGSMALFDRAIDTMTVFVGNGMQTEQASRMVHSAIERGYSEKDLGTMERYLAEGLRKNRSMDEIVSGMETRMERGEMRDMHESGGGMGGPGAGGMGSSWSGMGGPRH